MADAPAPQKGTRSVSPPSTRHNAALQRARLEAQRREQQIKNARRKQQGMRSHPRPPEPRSMQPTPGKSQVARNHDLTTSGVRAMPASKEEIVRRVKELDRANKKESREAREYEEMKWRPISWSEEMKDVARKDKDNPLAGQYLWMDDENALGSAAWIEKGINKTLKIDPTKKFEWDRWMKRSLPGKVGELGWEFVKGAANTIPSVMRVMSSGAYSASKLVSAPRN